ncbi:uncharacterized protein LOC108923909 [Scleropages formosus]|uniref:Uncharacterized LOC108923909 n=1 Tax=Scleropages formosus TaxID=113540 RepID=A0A8C9S2C7_SCLFO|nr:uncharacterized protein LOC108923909 [Scleropages formosus]
MKTLPFLLSAFLAAVTCQDAPTVSILQKFTDIYLGDTLVLRCSGSGSGDVKWYHKDTPVAHTKPVWIVPVLSAKGTLSYSCEQNGKKSSTLTHKINRYMPPGILSIKTGNSVVPNGESVILNLEVDGDLNGWICFTIKGEKAYATVFQKELIEQKINNIDFQSSPISIEQSPLIYWCKKRGTNTRSNTVTLTATNKKAVLVSHPDLPVSGTEVILECIVPGARTVEKVIFYKNDKEVVPYQSGKTYTIKNMTEDYYAPYYCNASYKYIENSNRLSDSSNVQKLEGREASLKAVISGDASHPKCSCFECPTSAEYRYYKDLEDGGKQLFNTASNLQPGMYSCRAVWDLGVSMMSDPKKMDNGENLEIPIIVILIVIALILILIGIAIIVIWKKRRTEALYQEVPLRAVKSNKGDGGYQDLQEARSGTRGGDYETLKGEREQGGEVEGARPERGYEALKTAPGAEKDTVYHTIKPEGSDGASKGDAIKGEEVKGREGGYEALKIAKEEEKEGLYQTIGQDEVKQE